MRTTIIILLLAGLITACGKKDKNGFLNVHLTDAPGDYKEVWVDVQQVKVHYAKNAQGTWEDLPTNSGLYDLLKLQNGVTTPLVSDAPVRLGKITQIRMILGYNNSLVLEDGTQHDLYLPGSNQGGNDLKIIVANVLKVKDQQTYDFTLDFDADKSIIEGGGPHGGYMLKPTIKLMP